MRIAKFIRKITPPLLPRTILSRSSLIDVLQDAHSSADNVHPSICKMLLLCAPAGYGKTTLLADFIQKSQAQASWYFLDHSDTNLVTFIETLIASIQQVIPAFAASLGADYIQHLAQAAADPVTFEQLIQQFLALLETDLPARFILCLCNYHEINDHEPIQNFMNMLIAHLPTDCILCIESRATPSIHLAPLLTQNQLVGLGNQALRFSAEEIYALFSLRQQVPLLTDIADAEKLTQLFEGWIVGILLSTQMNDYFLTAYTNVGDGPWINSTLQVSYHNLRSYIYNDIFKHEAEAYAFLLHCSVLTELSIPACNALLESETADALLTYIENRGLFVKRVNKEHGQRTYSLHPVLRELLYTELAQKQPDACRELQYRAALYFYALHEYDQAFQHALQTSAEDFLIEIILSFSERMPQDSNSQTKMMQWLDQLPSSLLENNPNLLLLRATLYISQYESPQAAPLLEKAYQLLQQTSQGQDEVTMTLLARIQYARSNILFKNGNYEGSQQLCKEALALMPIDETAFRIKTHIRFGDCAMVLGKCSEAITQLQHALQLCGHNTVTPQTAHIHTSLANAYTLISKNALAEHHRTRAIAICEQLGDSRTKINNLIWIGIMKRDKGDLSEACRMFQEIIEVSHQQQFLSGEAYGLFNLGGAYTDEGLYQQALKVVEDSLASARLLEDVRLINFNLCQLALIYLSMGDFDTAFFFIEQTHTEAAGPTSGEQIQCRLVLGTLYVLQQKYQQAYDILFLLQSYSEEAGQKRTTLECLVRLAACQLALKKETELEESCIKIINLVMQERLEQLAQRTLRPFPDVWKRLQRYLQSGSKDSWKMALPQEGKKEVPAAAPLVVSTTQSVSTSHTLQIIAFGEPVVIVDGTPVTRWRMARSMELCYFLLNVGRSVRKEQIIEALWSSPEDNIDQTLRSSLFYLRKAIGEACIVYRGGLYTLNFSALYGEHVSYDVDLFQQSFVQAMQAIEEKQMEQARELLNKTVALYQGDYVQSFYSDWCIGKRDELRLKYMRSRHELALIAWNDGETDECVQHWRYLLSIDNCSEEAHYGLMRCYMRQGKRGLAIRQYQRCVDILHEELDVLPGPAIQKFHQRLTSIN
ncbi:BTAD domain-containing putative transcriptional regulator [Dictyobacter kobayashii]|uniref:Bacterial transcriptional activator domain-containing protein n=1 Tax=Dictyobacter kobayashii TaxID=2014872 RepID=A0A402AVD5_9CHLR|nr:BTAD domain-containing putative transcriptional regulator [Dictyobacter kobayashii]GCE23076.1 hypothetical protein KDK_68760 [Dictyobacter kobayashii]